jgi:hypothetical protein
VKAIEPTVGDRREKINNPAAVHKNVENLFVPKGFNTPPLGAVIKY